MIFYSTNNILGMKKQQVGIVHREQFNEVPPHVDYSLTEKRKALLPVFFELAKWGEIYIDDSSETPERNKIE